MTQQFQVNFDINVLTQLFTEELNAYPTMTRRAGIRESLARAFRRYADRVGGNTEIKVSNDTFEMLAAEYTRLFDKYEEEQEKKAVPVGGGVYVDVVRDDDYHDITGGKS